MRTCLGPHLDRQPATKFNRWRRLIDWGAVWEALRWTLTVLSVLVFGGLAVFGLVLFALEMCGR